MSNILKSNTETKYKTLSQSLEDVIKCLGKSENYKSHCISQISDCDKALSDLDHKLELESLDAISMTKITSLRKKILNQRRFYKDEVELTNALTLKNSSIISELKTVISSYSNTEKELSERQYTPRVLFDLFDVDAEDVKATRKFINDIQVVSGKKPNRKQIELEKKFREIKKSS